MVRRYDETGLMEEAREGFYVLYTDYAALESENARLREALRECVAALEQCACPDCQPDSDLCVARGYPSCHVINAITKAREVLGDD